MSDKISKLDIGDMQIDIFRMCNQDKPFLIKMMEHLQKEFFEGKLFIKAFMLYHTYYKKYEKAPTEKIFKTQMVTNLGEDKETVDAFAKDIFGQEILDPGEKEYITDLVVAHARKQRVKEAIEMGYDLIEDGTEFTDDKFQEILGSMKESVKFSIDNDRGVDLYDIDLRYERIKANMGEKISSGYDQIDHFISGGFARKELAAIQAPPGLGKCGSYDNMVNIEIDENDPLYEKIKHLIKV